jgi:hypothetical protein
MRSLIGERYNLAMLRIVLEQPPIEFITGRMVDVMRPRRIVMFGSRARGDRFSYLCSSVPHLWRLALLF